MTLHEVDDELLRSWPLPAVQEGDKEDRGRVLIIAGCAEIPGAAVLAATAALRAGAGKVTIGTAASIASRVAFAVPESRVIALKEGRDGCLDAAAADALQEIADKCGAVLVGPGLAYGRGTAELTLELLSLCPEAGFVIDAAAMDVVQKSDPRVSRFVSPVVLTPHAGEMAKLTGLEKKAIEADAAHIARDAAKDWNAVLALKGAVTHIADSGGRLWRHDRGNSGLATSGSGDVLAGIVAGLIARGTPLEQAAVWGVALHARAGERLAERLGPLGYLARELPGEVPALMKALGS